MVGGFGIESEHGKGRSIPFYAACMTRTQEHHYRGACDGASDWCAHELQKTTFQCALFGLSGMSVALGLNPQVRRAA
jgi:hypothetical protein